MAWMVYLIAVTARTVVKTYDPYDILGVSRVSDLVQNLTNCVNKSTDSYFGNIECR